MSLSQRIAPHLPYLRRFARSITGNQTSGDAYVAAMLEALIVDFSIFPQTSSDRIGTYQLFCHLFDQTTPNIAEPLPQFGFEQKASAQLSYLTPRARQAFLLIAVEGFNESEAGEIMKIDKQKFHELLSQASFDISQQIATQVMIIEDEPLIAMDIEQMVESLGHQVIGIARTHNEAVVMYHQKKPRLILADIQLADNSSGIDAVNDILKNDCIPVIFITAFPERLLTGERPEPTFLVTKPFNPDMVKALISQALFFQENASKAA
ncbi:MULTISPECIES: response regulator [unclassified Bartonella]|uniref:response regulator n=1 Tax=Bartonella TaxID=773 RepID=UPI000999633D|nr:MULTISPECIES: response regulator [unclassified Bartonella]AQX18837.1 CheY chemotaxis protein or a CheY-like REC (receiver) domain [Bartonella sp. A1379B]AQX22060.1 CheY chemotaxis protein or a CheY-like REC (receiver) domain [Bartonella sp. 11B]AQX24662.1 CheY chemotaxis protein or a CheY-like REC (receiver) domain [Bartonella sp. 114]AQX25828.1 CheY chemotaxis protein or a CheY-like REC (receiver) domain [Bartonella sp. Coyote22sub2]